MVLIAHLDPEIIKVIRKLIISDDTLREYRDLFGREITKGIKEETAEKAKVKSYLTYVNTVPTGGEEGNFLALDFGSPIIRVMLVSMLDRECTVTSKMYEIPESMMEGKSKRLFHFIAKSVKDFLSGLRLKQLRIAMGLTLGFPLAQESLQDATLVRWSKGFDCPDVVGKDMLQPLRKAFRRFPELKRIYIVGVLNDSTSSVLAACWQDPRCKIGVVAGYGAGFCYVEKVGRVTKYHAQTYSEQYTFINIDSGALGDDGTLDFIRSEFDEELDLSSDNPGKQLNEKMISLCYLGELARLCLVQAIGRELILGGELTEQITTKEALTTSLMSRIESDPELEKHIECRAVMKEFGYSEVSDHDCIQIQFICRVVSRRSVNLVTAQLASLVNRVHDETVTIAGNGMLIKDYPHYLWYLNRKLIQLKNPNRGFSIVLTEDDALGRGAAVMAAIVGQDVMDRDEKLRRLPPFPMDECHFKKFDKCLNPNCPEKHPVCPGQEVKLEFEEKHSCTNWIFSTKTKLPEEPRPACIPQKKPKKNAKKKNSIPDV